MRQKIELSGAAITAHVTKIRPATQSSLEIMGPLTPAIAALMDVKSSVFTPKGDVKPGFAEMQIRYEGGSCRLTMKPMKSQIQTSLELSSDATRLHKVKIFTRAKKGKPPEAFIRFRLDLPTVRDVVLNTFNFVLDAGGSRFDTIVSFEQVEQARLFEQEQEQAPKKKGKPTKKPTVQ